MNTHKKTQPHTTDAKKKPVETTIVKMNEAKGLRKFTTKLFDSLFKDNAHSPLPNGPCVVNTNGWLESQNHWSIVPKKQTPQEEKVYNYYSETLVGDRRCPWPRCGCKIKIVQQAKTDEDGNTEEDIVFIQKEAEKGTGKYVVEVSIDKLKEEWSSVGLREGLMHGQKCDSQYCAHLATLKCVNCGRGDIHFGLKVLVQDGEEKGGRTRYYVYDVHG